MRPGPWKIARGSLSLEAPLVMGILNLTPDSFSDGGVLGSVSSALRRTEEMMGEGAAILDVGGESTRPGAPSVEADEEIRRVVPTIEAITARFPVPVSVDTRKSRVAQAAIDAGAAIVNDVSGLRFDPEMAGVVAASGTGAVLMHMRGTPADMREHTHYEGAVEEEVALELGQAVNVALRAGIDRSALVLDPGIGFAKSASQSLRLLGHLEPLLALGFPILVGPSRKSFLGELLGVPAEERAVGTAAACVLSFLQGARIFRVHDVGVTFQALQVAAAIQGTQHSEGEVRATT
ncbi:MAG: dihydropteroate synthase [Gemmatimonadota bacterium]